jgi:hypothetical protein
MKVLDLACQSGHTFEGWFGSEQDYVDQRHRGLVQCPVCSSVTVEKRLSAPRLNLAGVRGENTVSSESSGPFAVSGSVVPHADAASIELQQELQHALSRVVQEVMARTVDVGEQFAEEARRIHYGETEARAIRGKASVEDARELIEEGIELIALPIPEHLKKPLQ